MKKPSEYSWSQWQKKVIREELRGESNEKNNSSSSKNHRL